MSDAGRASPHSLRQPASFRDVCSLFVICYIVAASAAFHFSVVSHAVAAACYARRRPLPPVRHLVDQRRIFLLSSSLHPLTPEPLRRRVILPRPPPSRMMGRPAWSCALAAAIAACTGVRLAVATGSDAPLALPASPLSNCTAPFGDGARTYSHCQTLPGRVGNFALYWSADDITATIEMLFAATTVVPGWAGFGFSDDLSMIGTTAVVGLISDDGSASAGVYKLGGQTTTAVVPADDDDASAAAISGVEADHDGTVLRVAFSYSLQNDGIVSGFGPNGVIWAIGGAASGTSLSRHIERAAAQIEFGLSDADEAQEELVDSANVGTGPIEVQADPSAGVDLPEGDGDDANDTGTASADEDSADPTPSSSAVASECFPSSATVQLADGSRVRMDALAIGDHVHVGGGRISPVFLFSHASPDTVSSFVSLTTAAGPVLTLTPGHLLPVNGRMAPARAVVVGDSLQLGSATTFSAVVNVRAVMAQGLWNPHTLAGDIVVDGVQASTWTSAVGVVAGRSLLAPLAILYRLIGMGGAWMPVATAVMRASGGAGRIRDVVVGAPIALHNAL